MHDERYSTTCCLITEKPSCFDKSIDGTITLLKTSACDQKIAEGGLRLKGFFKTGSEEKPLITVVTVVYNGEEHLEGTIKSVINQDYQNVEYIIVDGGSKDGTLDIITKYEHAIDYWVSEPDKGIYDAMNKAIDLASGQWINFMNAGDFFFDFEVLSKIFSNWDVFKGFDVVYGDNEVRYPDKKRIAEAGLVEDVWKGGQFCHQAVFFSCEKRFNIKYDREYLIAADYDLFCRLLTGGAVFLRVFYPVASVSSGGVSDKNRFKVYDEWYQAALRSGVGSRLLLFLNHKLLKVSFFFKRTVKMVLN